MLLCTLSPAAPAAAALVVLLLEPARSPFAAAWGHALLLLVLLPADLQVLRSKTDTYEPAITSTGVNNAAQLASLPLQLSANTDTSQ